MAVAVRVGRARRDAEGVKTGEIKIASDPGIPGEAAGLRVPEMRMVVWNGSEVVRLRESEITPVGVTAKVATSREVSG
jgi:hypothetical protein